MHVHCVCRFIPGRCSAWYSGVDLTMTRWGMQKRGKGVSVISLVVVRLLREASAAVMSNVVRPCPCFAEGLTWTLQS